MGRSARYLSLRLGVGRDICSRQTHTTFLCLLGVSRTVCEKSPLRVGVIPQQDISLGRTPALVQLTGRKATRGVAGFPGCGTQAGMLGTRRGIWPCRSMCIASVCRLALELSPICMLAFLFSRGASLEQRGDAKISSRN